MTEPVTVAGGRAYFTDDLLVFAGRFVHARHMEIHSHSFVEIALVTGGEATHLSVAGSRHLQTGDVVFLRPGVWHGYDCADLELYNCCFRVELLHRELAWIREDPLLGYLVWAGPLSTGRRGVLTTHLHPRALHDCEVHLNALAALRSQPSGQHRSDLIGRLILVLGHLARAVAADRQRPTEQGRTHQVVVEAMRLLESDLSYSWTLTELATRLHVSRNYLLRLFKDASGLPPIAYLARRRVEVAAEQLLHTANPISQIGRSVGWPDQNYFARRFKAHYGLSATSYRDRFADRAHRISDMPVKQSERPSAMASSPAVVIDRESVSP
ncbi:MAG: helix-turn-helix domain-containing protein [Pseudonocardia sp.]|nr:helix-turn-helix domain-containing protein [Pseudonocardia sp.]